MAGFRICEASGFLIFKRVKALFHHSDGSKGFRTGEFNGNYLFLPDYLQSASLLIEEKPWKG